MSQNVLNQLEVFKLWASVSGSSRFEALSFGGACVSTQTVGVYGSGLFEKSPQPKTTCKTGNMLIMIFTYVRLWLSNEDTSP